MNPRKHMGNKICETSNIAVHDVVIQLKKATACLFICHFQKMWLYVRGLNLCEILPHFISFGELKMLKNKRIGVKTFCIIVVCIYSIDYFFCLRKVFFFNFIVDLFHLPCKLKVF